MSADEGGLEAERLTAIMRDHSWDEVLGCSCSDDYMGRNEHAHHLAAVIANCIAVEIDRLTRELAKYRGWHAEVRGEAAKLRAENAALRTALTEDRLAVLADVWDAGAKARAIADPAVSVRNLNPYRTNEEPTP